MDNVVRSTAQVMLVIARGEAQVSITSVNSLPNTLSHDCVHLLKTCLTLALNSSIYCYYPWEVKISIEPSSVKGQSTPVQFLYTHLHMSGM